MICPSGKASSGVCLGTKNYAADSRPGRHAQIIGVHSTKLLVVGLAGRAIVKSSGEAVGLRQNER